MLISCLLCYVLGSIPGGILVAKFFEVPDPRSQGSGNIGAANMSRVGGRKVGIITFLFDFLKAFVPISVFYFSGKDPKILAMAALAAVLGHCYSIFLTFKGGKGVSTMTGAFAILAPVPLLFAALAWALIFYVQKISSLAAMGALMVFMLFLVYFDFDLITILFAGIASTVVVTQHLENLRALIAGTERTFSDSTDSH